MNNPTAHVIYPYKKPIIIGFIVLLLGIISLIITVILTHSSDSEEIDLGSEIDTANYNYTKENPLAGLLPLATDFYTLSYDLTTTDSFDTEFTIIIDSYADFLDSATNRLLSLGSDTILDYNIIYRNWQNPYQFSGSLTGDSIDTILTSAFPNNFLTISSTQQVGDYTLTAVTTTDVGYTFTSRIIFKSTASGLTSCSAMAPLLTTKNSPNIPLDVLKSANSLK